jgi:hypothetical protein
MHSGVRIGHNEPNVLFERFDEEVVAVHLGTGVYHSMQGTAGDIFAMLGSAPTREELAAALVAKYAAPADVIAADLDRFLRALKEEGLTKEAPPSADAPAAPSLPGDASATRLPYTPPVLDAHRELEKLFLLDPVHDTAEAGWPHVKPTEYEDSPQRYRLDAANCVLEKFDEATIVLNVATGAYFSFPGVAEDVLALLPEAPTSAELAQALSRKYAATEAELLAALTPFLKRLVEARLVTPEPIDGSEAPRPLALAHTGPRLAVPSLDFETFRDAPVTALGTPETQAELSMLSGNKRFHLITSQAIYALTPDGGVVVHLTRGEYFVLNPTTAHVFRLLEAGATVTEIASALRREYDVKRSEVVAAVVILLRSLTALRLVEIVEDVQGSAPAAARADGADIRPFAPFSIDIRTDLRESMCLYPDGPGVDPAPAYQGQQLAALLGEYFAHAAARHQVSDTFLEIAGRHVRIRCIGEEKSRQLSRAFSHLVKPLPSGASPDLTIHVWDGKTAGPAPNGLLTFYLQGLYGNWIDHCGPRGELKTFHGPEVPAFYAPGPDIVNLIDLANRNAFFLQRASEPLPYWETGSPFRTILHAWLSPLGLQFIHGAGLGEQGRGVILAGKGGSGKSTTSLLCLNAGLQYAGDDYCAVTLPPAAQVHSLYNTAKLLPADLDRFPNLRPRLFNPQSLFPGSTEKSTFFLSDIRPDLLVAGLPVRALLLPRVTGQARTTVTECSQSDALAAIAPSTVAQLPGAGPADMARMAAMIADLPCYALNLGTERAEIPDVIRGVLHG